MPENLLLISYLEHKINDWVRSKINSVVGPWELFWQLSRDGNLHPWFTHVTCHISLSKTMLQGMYLGGWAAPWSAEEMLIVQHRRVDIPSHARTAHKGLLLKRLEEDLC